MPETLVLKQHQLDHFTRILDILSRHGYYLDFSRMGTGKTYVCAKVAETLNLRIGVVCPVSAMNAWNQMKQYGIDIVFAISYQSLRGTDKYPPKHGYLDRYSEIKDEKRKVTFTTTDKFNKLVEEGLLLVFDEGHNIKNATDQGKAARTMSLAVKAPSKCAFISSSPYDKEEHSVNIMRFLDIVKSKSLIWNNPRTGERVPKGLLDAVNYSRNLDDAKTDDIVGGMSLSMPASKARSMCHKLFTEVIKDHLYSEMMPEVCEYPVHMEESYIYMEGDNLKQLTNGIDDLARATRFDGENIDTENMEWGAITLALQQIELAMLDPIVSFAKDILNRQGETNKVIISVSFLDSVKNLASQLEEYKPLIIDGSVSSINRTKRVSVFNEDPDRRILISTIKTGGISISLHDTVGDAPRHYLLVPTYSIIDIYQASGRIHRTGLKSDAYFYMMYGTNIEHKDKRGAIIEKGTIKVTPILSALSRKKDVLKGLITKQSSVYKLPGEFPAKYY